MTYKRIKIIYGPWICGACGTGNLQTEENCKKCGAWYDLESD